MKHTINRRTAVAALLGVATPVWAQTSDVSEAAAYPNKPIHLFVPFAPGGSTDVTARIFAQELQKTSGQPVIVENRGGAAGTIGTLAGMQAPADGYSLIFSTSTNQVIAPLLMAKPPYDGARDFTPVTPIVRFVGLLLVNGSLPVKTVPELIAYAKARPGKLNYASAGIGSTNHLLGELFKMRTGVDILHVPYKGSSGGTIALASDEVQVTFDTIPGARAFLKQGKVRALATVGDHRSSLMPELPTLVELKIFDGAADYWMGVVAPPKTPAPIVARIHQAIAQVASSTAFREHASSSGGEIALSTPSDFSLMLKSEAARWGEVIRANHIQAE